MPVLLLEQDPYVPSLSGDNDDLAFEVSNVRRPFEGMVAKTDRPAFLSVYRAEGGTF